MPPSNVLHQTLCSFVAPAAIVIAAVKTAVNPKIPMNELAKPNALA
jgi:hypothetical protein